MIVMRVTIIWSGKHLTKRLAIGAFGPRAVAAISSTCRNLMNLNEMERIVCIVLDDRKWTIPYFDKISKYFNIKIEYFIVGKGLHNELKYSYIDQSFLFLDKMLSYKTLAKKMQMDKCDHFLIMEDDVTFTKDINDVLSEIKWPDKWHNINLSKELLGVVLDDGQVVRDLCELHFMDLEPEFKQKYLWYIWRHYHFNGLYPDIGDLYQDIVRQNQPCLVRCFRTWGLAGTILHNSSYDALIDAPFDSGMDNAIYRHFNDNRGPIDNYSYMVFPQVMYDRLLPELQNTQLHIRLPFLWAQSKDRILTMGEDFRGI
jgi:hypothetical protein